MGRSVARANRLEVTFIDKGTALIDNFDLARGSVVTVYAWGAGGVRHSRGS